MHARRQADMLRPLASRFSTPTRSSSFTSSSNASSSSSVPAKSLKHCALPPRSLRREGRSTRSYSPSSKRRWLSSLSTCLALALVLWKRLHTSQRSSPKGKSSRRQASSMPPSWPASPKARTQSCHKCFVSWRGEKTSFALTPRSATCLRSVWPRLCAMTGQRSSRRRRRCARTQDSFVDIHSAATVPRLVFVRHPQ